MGVKEKVSEKAFPRITASHTERTFWFNIL